MFRRLPGVCFSGGPLFRRLAGVCFSGGPLFRRLPGVCFSGGPLFRRLAGREFGLIPQKHVPPVHVVQRKLFQFGQLI